MPLYTYTCGSCLQKFDLLVGMTSEKASLQCPQCGSKDIHKVFAPFTVVSSGAQGSRSSSSCSTCSGGNCSTC